MLTSLYLSNLKSFRGRHEVPLAPLTLVYGQNSSGKSTVLQALLLFVQTLRRGNTEQETRPATRGPWTDLGSDTGIVHGHDRTRELELGLRWQPADSETAIGVVSTFRWQRGAAYSSLTDCRFEFGDQVVRLRLRSAPVHGGSIANQYFATPDAHQAVALTSLLDAAAEATGKERLPAELTSQIASERVRLTFPFLGLLPGRASKWLTAGGDGLPPADQRELLERLWWDYATSLSEVANSLRRLSYLGPLRSAPQRFVIASGEDRAGVGVTGDRATEILRDDRELLATVNVWLDRLGLPYQLEVEVVGGESTDSTIGDLLALVLTDARTGLRVAASDVGFGVSQLLPIVVQVLLSQDSLILIEQPEIHVHPGLQAELADLLIYSTLERGNQLIVETHSEHLLLRLQRRMRIPPQHRARLDPRKVAILYVDSLLDGAADVQRLRLGEDGEFIDEWPRGFFEERYREVFSSDAAPPRS